MRAQVFATGSMALQSKANKNGAGLCQMPATSCGRNMWHRSHPSQGLGLLLGTSLELGSDPFGAGVQSGGSLETTWLLDSHWTLAGPAGSLAETTCSLLSGLGHVVLASWENMGILKEASWPFGRNPCGKLRI